MEDNQIINLRTLKQDILLAKLEGKNVVISEKADQAIAAIKMAEKQIDDVIQLVKSYVPEALKPFNAKTLRGKYCTISMSKPKQTSKYTIDDETKDEFVIKRIMRVANVEAIEAFIDQRGYLPPGVHLNEPKPVISIRAKALESEDDEDI